MERTVYQVLHLLFIKLRNFPDKCNKKEIWGRRIFVAVGKYEFFDFVYVLKLVHVQSKFVKMYSRCALLLKINSVICNGIWLLKGTCNPKNWSILCIKTLKTINITHGSRICSITFIFSILCNEWKLHGSEFLSARNCMTLKISAVSF